MRRKTHEEQREWFWQQIVKTESGCWIWQRVIQPRGYGMLRSGGTMTLAHRFAWRITHGSIPAGMEVCHACDVRACVNPNHLFIGSHRANMVDAWNKNRLRVPRNGYETRDRCKNGHAFTPENLKVEKDRARRCLTCARNSSRETARRMRARRKVAA